MLRATRVPIGRNASPLDSNFVDSATPIEFNFSSAYLEFGAFPEGICAAAGARRRRSGGYVLASELPAHTTEVMQGSAGGSRMTSLTRLAGRFGEAQRQREL
jgi:hypothetical protein